MNEAGDRLLRLAAEGEWDEWAKQFAPGPTVRQNFSGGIERSVADVVAMTTDNEYLDSAALAPLA